MAATFYQSTIDNIQAPARPAAPIRDAPAPTAVAEPVTGSRGCVRAYCNSARNSRLPLALTGPISVRWRADLDPAFGAAFVLAGDDRIVVVAADAWLALDGGGRVLARDRRGPGDAVVDPASGRFYFADPSGSVAAHRLADGGRAFHLSVYSGSDFRRTLIQPDGPRVLVVSVETLTNPHSSREPSVSALEVFALGEPFELSDTGRLRSAQRQNYLMTRTAHLLSAMHGSVLALATHNRLYFADAALRLESELTGEFTPRWLSLDAEGRAYMVVESAGHQALWIVARTGARVARPPLPAGFDVLAPPIVGYDRMVYLLGTQRVVAVSPAGAILWDRALDAPAVGAAVTGDGKLVVTTGAALDTYDIQGRRDRLFTAEGDVLVTPVAATPDGDLLVAGRRSVYRLRQ